MANRNLNIEEQGIHPKKEVRIKNGSASLKSPTTIGSAIGVSSTPTVDSACFCPLDANQKP